MTTPQRSPQPSGNDQGSENTPRSTPQSTDRLTQILSAAIKYAGVQQWGVLPLHGIINDCCTCGSARCQSPGKHPRTHHGVKDATTDVLTVLGWWEKWPNSNIGIATGRTSGLLVVDIDPRNGGDDTIDTLVEKHGQFPDTVEALTGGGGSHLLYDYPTGGHPISGTVLADGVDIKSDGGYIVAPPSVHISGSSYEWELSSHPSDTEVVPPPEWLVEQLRNPLLTSKSGANAKERLDPAKILAGVPVGERNETMFRYFCRLREKNLAWDECIVLGRQVINASPSDPPFPESEMLTCLNSAFKYEPVNHHTTTIEARGDGFRIVHGDEIENLPEPEWLIENVLVEGSLAFLYGTTGAYKSFTALDMAGAISTGVSWQGREVQQGNVVYVAAEGVGDLGVRVRAYKTAHELESLPDVSYVLEPVNLFTGAVHRGEADKLCDQIEDLEPVLIIFDTLARSMAGGDESFASSVNSVIASLDRLRHRTGATVLVIHHSGHDKSRERGSSALKAAADTFIKQTSKGLVVTLKCEKMKYGPDFDPITIQMIEMGESLTVVSGPLTPDLKPELVACVTLVSADGITHGDWKRAFTNGGHGSESTFNRHRKALVKEKFVEQADDGDSSVYRLTETGREATGVTSVTEVSTQS